MYFKEVIQSENISNSSFYWIAGGSGFIFSAVTLSGSALGTITLLANLKIIGSSLAIINMGGSIGLIAGAMSVEFLVLLLLGVIVYLRNSSSPITSVDESENDSQGVEKDSEEKSAKSKQVENDAPDVDEEIEAPPRNYQVPTQYGDRHEVFKAVGDIEKLKGLFEEGYEANCQDSKGETLLHKSTKNPDGIAFLLTKGVNPKHQDENGKTPLITATENRNSKTIELLLKECKETMGIPDKEGKTPLFFAFTCERIFSLLLTKGADINHQDNYQKTALHHLLLLLKTERYSLSDVKRNIQTLLEKGANLTLADENGDTPLHIAIKNNLDFELIVQLIGKESEALNIPNNEGKTPLHLATETNNVPVLEHLIQKGADQTIQDNNRDTPLHKALKNDSFNITAVRLLLKRPDGINIPDKKGKTPLFYTLNREGVMAMLLSRGANPNHVDEDTKTPLHHLASRWFELTCFKWLLAYGAKTDAQDKDNQLPINYYHPLQTKSFGGTEERAQKLLRGDENAKDLGKELLKSAIEDDNKSDAKKIVNRLPELLSAPMDREEHTAAALARLKGRTKIYEMLKRKLASSKKTSGN